MEEIMQKIIDSVRWWLNKVIAAFKADWYIWGCLVAVAPFAGLWAGAKLFWLIADLIWRILKQHGEWLLVFFGVPVLFAFGFWFFFLRNAPPPKPEHPPETLASAQARAKANNEKLKDAVFMLLQELCGYLPGLTRPSSSAAITAKVPFDITADFVVIYHFVIGMGDNIVPVDTMGEIFTRLINQHLRVNNLPLAIAETYQASDGSTWPGLVLDGIYPLQTHYRIDLLITGEPEVARLKAKNLAQIGGQMGAAAPHDPDFD